MRLLHGIEKTLLTSFAEYVIYEGEELGRHAEDSADLDLKL